MGESERKIHKLQETLPGTGSPNSGCSLWRQCLCYGDGISKERFRDLRGWSLKDGNPILDVEYSDIALKKWIDPIWSNTKPKLQTRYFSGGKGLSKPWYVFISSWSADFSSRQKTSIQTDHPCGAKLLEDRAIKGICTGDFTWLPPAKKKWYMFDPGSWIASVHIYAYLCITCICLLYCIYCTRFSTQAV